MLWSSHAGFGPLCVALADCALTLMETIMADLKLESLSPTAVSHCDYRSLRCQCQSWIDRARYCNTTNALSVLITRDIFPDILSSISNFLMLKDVEVMLFVNVMLYYVILLRYVICAYSKVHLFVMKIALMLLCLWMNGLCLLAQEVLGHIIWNNQMENL